MQQKLPKARYERHNLEGNWNAINNRQWVIMPNTGNALPEGKK